MNDTSLLQSLKQELDILDISLDEMAEYMSAETYEILSKRRSAVYERYMILKDTIDQTE